MAVFEVEHDGKKYRVDAPDPQAAAEGFSLHTGTKSDSTFLDRLQKVWDNPTPGGLPWLAKQAVQGVKGAIDSAKVANMDPQTEGDAAAVNQAREMLPGYAAQAASVMAPGAPRGTGGAAAAPFRQAPDAVARLPVVRDNNMPVPRPPAADADLPPTVAAAQRLSEVTGNDITIPRAVASDSTAVQRAGQGIRNIPIVGDRIPQATERLVENLGQATRDVADQFGTGSGPNVANRVGRGLQEGAEAETRAATDAARRSDEAVTGAWQRDQDAAAANITAREGQSLEQARAAVGDMSPQDMGGVLIHRLRTDEASARAHKDALYDRAGRADASVRLDAVQGVRNHVVESLEEAGVVIDPQLTPAANRMLDELQRLGNLNIPNRAQLNRPAAPGDERVGVTVQGIEQARKRLVSIRSAALNDADRRAARLVMDRFDRWQSDAFENALISGDDAALRSFREARTANTNWRGRFFNDDNDAGKFINRIVTGEVTPQEVANVIIGSGQVGSKGVASRLLTEIAEATENNPEAMQAISGGIWNKLTQSTAGADAKPPATVIRDIVEFLNGSGRDVANRLFTPEQRRLMNSYADTLRRGADARQLIGEVAANTKPGATEVPAGPLKQLADAVIGKGTKSDEALFRLIDGYAKSTNKGDVGTLAKLVAAIPQQDRGDLAGSIIRQLGISPRTGQFSPDVFVSQWGTYSPQAKAVLFGNAGPHRKAIDDIALISARLKEVGSKFGNPSGTAQHVNAYAMATGLIASPLSTIATAIGGSLAAKFLAAPAGASSIAKWAKAYQGAILAPSPQSVGVMRMASRNLANTAHTLGIKLQPGDLLRALQAPGTSRASDDEQP